VSTDVAARARRRSALLLLKLVSLVLRSAVALRVSGLSLRCLLSLVSALERAAVLLLFGHQGRQKRTLCDKS
jgi:hypothetical protein